MDIVVVPRVCVRSSVGISPKSRHQGLLTQTWPFALNPRILPRSLSASRQHLCSPLRFTTLWRETGVSRKEGGCTVQQLFIVVLSSYFTRKQSHSTLNSSSCRVSSSIRNAFLHRYIYCTLSLLYGCTSLQTFHWLSTVHPSVDLYLKRKWKKNVPSWQVTGKKNYFLPSVFSSALQKLDLCTHTHMNASILLCIHSSHSSA